MGVLKVSRARAARNLRKLGRLTARRAERLADRTRALCCSEPWYEVCAGAIARGEVAVKTLPLSAVTAGGRFTGGRIDTAEEELAGRGLYPPAAPLRKSEGAREPRGQTLMRRCARCRVGMTWFPPQYLNAGSGQDVCEDCKVGRRAIQSGGLGSDWIRRWTLVEPRPRTEPGVYVPAEEIAPELSRAAELEEEDCETRSSSPIYFARRELEARNLRIESLRLEPATAAALRRQIERYLATAAGEGGETGTMKIDLG